MFSWRTPGFPVRNPTGSPVLRTMRRQARAPGPRPREADDLHETDDDVSRDLDDGGPGAPGCGAWTLAALPVAALLAGTALAVPAQAAAGHAAGPADGPPGHGLTPGDLLVSGSTFTTEPDIVAGQTELPPGCTTGCAVAIAGGDYPYVFNNDTVDSSFGVTSKISLTELTPTGRLVGSLEVPNSSSLGLPRRGDQMVTSFSSKSEMALNLSTERPVRELHGVQRASGWRRRVELEHARRHRLDQSRTRRLLPNGRHARRPGKIPIHRDQRLQRQQRAGRHLERQPRRQCALHRGQRRQRRQPATRRCRVGSGRPDHPAGPSARSRRRTRDSQLRSGASASPSSATKPTRSERTTTSGA